MREEEKRDVLCLLNKARLSRLRGQCAIFAIPAYCPIGTIKGLYAIPTIRVANKLRNFLGESAALDR
jgi:hypothetical protein